MGTNCEACQGKHRAHTCKVVRRTTRGRTRRSPLEAVENALSFCAPGPRMLRMSSCGLCLAKDRKIAALERRLMHLESDLKIAACDEKIKENNRKIAACDEQLEAASDMQFGFTQSSETECNGAVIHTVHSLVQITYV